MFCGFISFFFLLLNYYYYYYYYYLLYGIYEHTLIQIHTFNKFKKAICFVPSLGRVMYDLLKCTFLVSDEQLGFSLTLKQQDTQKAECSTVHNHILPEHGTDVLAVRSDL
mgnify:CR=1 FL=1